MTNKSVKKNAVRHARHGFFKNPELSGNMVVNLNNLVILFVILLSTACGSQKSSDSSTNARHKTTLTKSRLQDKIKGGWAGQVIGCTYGGPTEFRYQGRIIPDSVVIPWDETRCL